MADQFFKFKKNLGNGSKPDTTADATWAEGNTAGRPSGSPVKMTIDSPDYAVNVDPNGGVKQTPPKKLSKRAQRFAAMRLSSVRSEGNLKRIDTSQAGTRPLPDLSDRVRRRQANPEYLAADVQRENEDRAARTEASRKKSTVKTSTSNNISEFEPEKPKGVKPSGYRPGKSAKDIAAEKADALLTQGAKIAEEKEEKEGKNPRKSRKYVPGGKPKPSKPSEVIGKTPIFEEQGPSKSYVEEDPDKMFGHLTDEEYDLRAEEPDILSTTMREIRPEGPARSVVVGHTPVLSPAGPSIPYDKPTVNAPGNVLPQRAMNTFGNQRVDRAQADRENKRLRAGTVPATSTTTIDQNNRPARAKTGNTPESQTIAAVIRRNYAADLAKDNKTLTTVAPEVLKTAKGIGKSSKYNLTDEYMDTPEFLGGEQVRMAKVAHAFGVHHLLGTDSDPLAKYLGKRTLESSSRLQYLHKIVDRHLRGNPEVVPGEFETFRNHVRAGLGPQAAIRALKKNLTTKVTIGGQSPTLAEPAPIAGVKTVSAEGSRQAHANATANILDQQRKSRQRVMIATNGQGATPSIKDLTAAHAAGHIEEHEAMDLNPKIERLEKSTPKFTEISAAHAEGHITEEEGKDLNPNWNTNVSQQFTGVGTTAAPDARVGRLAFRKVGEEPSAAAGRELTTAEIANKVKNVPKTDDSKKFIPDTGKTDGEPNDIPRNADTYSENMLEKLKRGPKRITDVADES